MKLLRRNELTSSRQNHTTGRERVGDNHPKGKGWGAGGGQAALGAAQWFASQSTTPAPTELAKIRRCCPTTVRSPLTRCQRTLHPPLNPEGLLRPQTPPAPGLKSGMEFRERKPAMLNVIRQKPAKAAGNQCLLHPPPSAAPFPAPRRPLARAKSGAGRGQGLPGPERPAAGQAPPSLPPV